MSFERKIAVQNVADLDPPRWLTRLIASHPPTLERIGAAVAFAQAAIFSDASVESPPASLAGRCRRTRADS